MEKNCKTHHVPSDIFKFCNLQHTAWILSTLSTGKWLLKLIFFTRVFFFMMMMNSTVLHFFSTNKILFDIFFTGYLYE